MVIFNLKKDYLEKVAMAKIYDQPLIWWYNLTDILDGRAQEWNALAKENPYANKVLGLIRQGYWSKIKYFEAKYGMTLEEATKAYGILVGYSPNDGIHITAIGPYKISDNERKEALKWAGEVGIIKDTAHEIPNPQNILNKVNELLPAKVKVDSNEIEGVNDDVTEEMVTTMYGNKTKKRDLLLRYRCELLNKFNFFNQKYGHLSREQVKASYERYIKGLLENIAIAWSIPSEEVLSLETELSKDLNINDVNLVLKYLSADGAQKIVADDELAVEKKGGFKSRKPVVKKQDEVIDNLGQFIDSPETPMGEYRAFVTPQSQMRLKPSGMLKVFEKCFASKKITDIYNEVIATLCKEKNIDPSQYQALIGNDTQLMQDLILKLNVLKQGMLKNNDARANLMPEIISFGEFESAGAFGQQTPTANKVGKETIRKLNRDKLVLDAVLERIDLKKKTTVSPSGKPVRNVKLDDYDYQVVTKNINSKLPRNTKAKGEYTVEIVKSIIDSIRIRLGEGKKKLSFADLAKKTDEQKASIINNAQLSDVGYSSFKEIYEIACLEWEGPPATDIDPATRARLHNAVKSTFGTSLEGYNFDLKSEFLALKHREAYEALVKRSVAENRPIQEIKQSIYSELDDQIKLYIKQHFGKDVDFNAPPPEDVKTIEQEANEKENLPEEQQEEEETEKTEEGEEQLATEGIGENFDITEEPIEQVKRPTSIPEPAMENGFDINEISPTETSQPTSAQPVMPIDNHISEIPVDDMSMPEPTPVSRRKKRKQAPVIETPIEEDTFSYTIKNLVKIASDLDNKGKFSAAEEIHKIIRKYI